MLLVAVILDAIITVPLMTIPQGVGYIEFFFSIIALPSYLAYLLVPGIYWVKKVK